ncbi:MAG: DUF2461 family protein [Flavobacteriaceae bacterium]|jgi:hypothetical protein
MPRRKTRQLKISQRNNPYCDVLFSKDNTPYITHFGMAWHHSKAELRGGYYLHLKLGDVSEIFYVLIFVFN